MAFGTLNRRTKAANNNNDLYFIKLKDSSSLLPVEKNLLDEHSDYFIKKSINDYQLSQLNVINLDHVSRDAFENIVHCLKKGTFPIAKYPDGELHLKSAQETFLEAEALCLHKVCILVECHLRNMLSKENCILIWQLTYKSSQNLRNLAVQAFSFIVCFFSHQLYHHRKSFQSLKAKELLTILKSPYLCLLDPTETFHLIGNYFVITILTLIDVWSEARTNIDTSRLREKLNLPKNVKSAIKAYHEDHDPTNELKIISNYKFCSLGFAVYYPRNSTVCNSQYKLVCPTLRIDPKRWTLKSIQIFMDLKERYITGCIQNFINIWQNKEVSIKFGNVDTRNTSPGGCIEIGPGEAITAVQIFRTYIPNGNNQNHGPQMRNKWGCRDKNTCQMLFGSAGEAEILPSLKSVISRFCLTITTYACGSLHTFPRMGLKRMVSLPLAQHHRYDLEESYVNVDVSEVRENCLSTASHLFGFANYVNISSQMTPDQDAITDFIPVWSAADKDALETLKKYMMGSFCCAEDLKENEILMTDSFSNKVVRRNSNAKKSIQSEDFLFSKSLNKNFNSLPRRSLSRTGRPSSVMEDFTNKIPRNQCLTMPKTESEFVQFEKCPKQLPNNKSSCQNHACTVPKLNSLNGNFLSCNDLDKVTRHVGNTTFGPIAHNQSSRGGFENPTDLSNADLVEQFKRDIVVPMSNVNATNPNNNYRRRVVFSKNHYLHHFSPEADCQSARDSAESTPRLSRFMPRNYLNRFEDSDTSMGFPHTHRSPSTDQSPVSRSSFRSKSTSRQTPIVY